MLEPPSSSYLVGHDGGGDGDDEEDDAPEEAVWLPTGVLLLQQLSETWHESNLSLFISNAVKE